jgi:phosphopantothenoylcysteine decarboxylase/phosphopantothenate--cysteine ligase
LLVALGVTGGIAAYKACEVIRGLDRAGVEVQVILTRNAVRFVTPLTLQTLSRRRVLLDPFDLAQDETIQHIDLTRRIAALIVAPATANTMAKFSRGIADDLLSTFYISVTAPVLMAPAMNTRMWEHPATRENLERLQARGVQIVPPDSGWLAEGESGWGRLAEPEAIVEATLRVLRRSEQLVGRKIVVSAGPTREDVDPVRFLSNRSSGRMGFALASAAASRGASVELICGPVALPTPHQVQRLDVETSQQMREAVLQARQGADAIFMAAAVADFIPRAATSKIKKTAGTLTLELDRGNDILAELGAHREQEILVGFAAETESVVENAQGKLVSKNLDFIVANDVSRSDVGFDSPDNAVTILGRDGRRTEVARCSKIEVAEAILDRVFGPAEPACTSGGAG